MGAWYRVVKKVKGRRYAYLQRTWRKGKTVHTENQYLGPVDGAERASEPRARAGEHTGPAGPRIAYHGARNGLDGPIQASPEGTFGPGFYLTTQKRAAEYARHTAKDAAQLPSLGGVKPTPRYDGIVYACDLTDLKLKTVPSWLAYYDLVDELLQVDQGYATDEDKQRVQEILSQQGYDGLDVRDDERRETVIFPGSLHKIRLEPLDGYHYKQDT